MERQNFPNRFDFTLDPCFSLRNRRPNMSVFSIQNLCWTYPGSEKPVLQDFSLEIPRGKTTVLLGPSGSGKTTFIQILGLLWDAGLFLKTKNGEAEVLFHGNSGTYAYSKLSQADKDKCRETDFGFILQNSYVLPQFNCWQNIAMSLLLHGVSEAQSMEIAFLLLQKESDVARADGLGPEESLWDKRETSAREFSLGQRQRIAILRAIATNPMVIFADEPTSNLDPKTARHICGLLKEWRDGMLGIGGQNGSRSLVVVTHNLQHAYQNDYFGADYFVRMGKNEIGQTVTTNIRRDDIGNMEELLNQIGHDL